MRGHYQCEFFEGPPPPYGPRSGCGPPMWGPGFDFGGRCGGGPFGGGGHRHWPFRHGSQHHETHHHGHHGHEFFRGPHFGPEGRHHETPHHRPHHGPHHGPHRHEDEEQGRPRHGPFEKPHCGRRGPPNCCFFDGPESGPEDCHHGPPGRRHGPPEFDRHGPHRHGTHHGRPHGPRHPPTSDPECTDVENQGAGASGDERPCCPRFGGMFGGRFGRGGFRRGRHGFKPCCRRGRSRSRSRSRSRGPCERFARSRSPCKRGRSRSPCKKFGRKDIPRGGHDKRGVENEVDGTVLVQRIVVERAPRSPRCYSV